MFVCFCFMTFESINVLEHAFNADTDGMSYYTLTAR